MQTIGLIARFFRLWFPYPAVLLAVLLIGPPGGVAAAFAQTFQTNAPHAILIDSASGSVLFEKDADALVVPASTVKIMTAEVVFHEIALGHLKLDDQFVVSETAWRYGGAPSRGSAMFAAPNSSVRVEDLIRGLVIVSGNDAAIALAEGIAGSEGAFATLMTKRARELGLAHSTFTNAWGRDDPEQKVSPKEMAILANHVIQTYPDLYKYFGEKDFTWNKIKQANRNPLLTMDLGADGLKTGNIDKSGYGIVASAVQNGQRLILALYGAPTAKERSEEARKIFLWGFRSFDSKTIFQAGETIGSAKVYGGSAWAVPLVADKEVKILVPRTATGKFTGHIIYTGPLLAPVEAGKEVARLKIFRGTDLI
ncbi:MAG: serine hydrolase, partial [Methylocella sp.]